MPDKWSAINNAQHLNQSESSLQLRYSNIYIENYINIVEVQVHMIYIYWTLIL